MIPNSVRDRGFRRKQMPSTVERHIGKQMESNITMDGYQYNFGMKYVLTFER